ncbi:MAG: hypothetical protein DRP42_07320 [Tenericutes bacterium]|nr:MAG: hypothetical protein DRP42_07320 [Mycoplasmatota bacterium]
MLTKEAKIRVLENFYGIDYVLFGKPIKKVESCCPILKEEYLSTKGALMSVFIEMVKMADFSPKPLVDKVDLKKLSEMARESAKLARKASEIVIVAERARKDIKQELQEALKESSKVDINKLAEQKIREKAFRLAIDSLMVGKLLVESKNLEAFSQWEGKIIEDSYKILRDSLCETAISILENDE